MNTDRTDWIAALYIVALLAAYLGLLRAFAGG